MVTYFYFGGRCDEAMKLYEKAFKKMSLSAVTGGAIHTEMCIYGQRVMVKDIYGNIGNNTKDFQYKQY